MKEAKQIAYSYDTILADEEAELDLDGTVAAPVKGDTRQHSGKTWRVEHVTIEHAGEKTIPIYCAYFKEVAN